MSHELFRRDDAVPARARARYAPAGNAACLNLIAALALIVSLVVAVTAISIGIARAGAVSALPTEMTLSRLRGAVVVARMSAAKSGVDASTTSWPRIWLRSSGLRPSSCGRPVTLTANRRWRSSTP